MWEVLGEVVGWVLGAAGAVAGTGLVVLARWVRAADREIQLLKREAESGRESRLELDRLKIGMAGLQADRGNWVPLLSRAMGTIERHGESIARLEERTEKKGGVTGGNHVHE